MPLIGMSCASRVTSRLGCRDVAIVWHKWTQWTNEWTNARSRWWRPTWKTIVPWGRFPWTDFLVEFFEGDNKEKKPSFSKEAFCPTRCILVSYHQGVRKVVIYYYLEDDTCQIQEPKMDNSGMPQGALCV